MDPINFIQDDNGKNRIIHDTELPVGIFLPAFASFEYYVWENRCVIVLFSIDWSNTHRPALQSISGESENGTLTGTRTDNITDTGVLILGLSLGIRTDYYIKYHPF